MAQELTAAMEIDFTKLERYCLINVQNWEQRLCGIREADMVFVGQEGPDAVLDAKTCHWESPESEWAFKAVYGLKHDQVLRLGRYFLSDMRVWDMPD